MSVTQETTTPSTERLTGQVKGFNTKAGYGFITVCDGEHAGKDIFVHFSSLSVVNSQYRYLVQGEYVEFRLVKSESEKYEYHAVNVSGVKGGVIMCETHNVNNDRSQSRAPVRKPVRRTQERPQRADTQKTDAPVKDSQEDGEFQRVTKKRTQRPKSSA
jgi:cold shock CspA family protein